MSTTDGNYNEGFLATKRERADLGDRASRVYAFLCSDISQTSYPKSSNDRAEQKPLIRKTIK